MRPFIYIGEKTLETNIINVALLGATPPSSGGIASWTDRMLKSDCFRYEKLYLVDERQEEGREVFGDNSKIKISGEIKRCFRIWRDLISCIRKNGIQVVHSNTPATTTSLMREILCSIIARFHRCAVIGHFHCTVPVVISSSLQKLMLKIYLSLCNSAIVLNERSLEYVKANSKCPVFLIPNFISKRELLRSQEGRATNAKVTNVLYVGGIVEEKGVFDILDIAKRHPDINFRLAGAGSIPATIEPTSNVHLLGTLNSSELANEYSKNDVFLFLTHFPAEGFSCALLEAMSFGMPCVVTDWAANADMIGAKSGCVVPCHDLDAAERALRRLSDQEVRRQVGHRNAEKVRQLYGEAIVVPKYSEVYRFAYGKLL